MTSITRLPIEIIAQSATAGQPLAELEGINYSKLELVIMHDADGYYDGIYCLWSDWDKTESGKISQLNAIIDCQAEQLAKLAGQVTEGKEQRRRLLNEVRALTQAQADEGSALKMDLQLARAESQSMANEVADLRAEVERLSLNGHEAIYLLNGVRAPIKAIYANGHAEPLIIPEDPQP